MVSVNCLTAGLTLYTRINNKTPARCALASSRVCTEGSYLSVSAPVTCCHLLFRRVLALQQNRLRVYKSWHLRRFQGPRPWRETRPKKVSEVWSSPRWMTHFAQQPCPKKKTYSSGLSCVAADVTSLLSLYSAKIVCVFEDGSLQGKQTGFGLCPCSCLQKCS